ncbi:phage tail protein I [Vibrio sp. V37_P2S8PM304]|uniref:phage tail protein I n=1 Tax=Vibrio sp. V37_P2S8PM304 TaxID=1938688 RepID=UPI001372DAC7|nr:phage tail protein I [Vibrio sp. V37_P2S8PM304]NAX31984.1 phage tail protein I [Vibrio sp. V37_P2S8PM304]
MSEEQTILPGNLSSYEHELDKAISYRYRQIASPVATTWDPWNCPFEILPYLGWALSVDYYQSHWSEKVKRQVVADSMDYHRTKGTRGAVEQAVENLGLSAKLTEWWQMVPEGLPGTFVVDVYASDTPLTEEIAAELGHAIDNAKRKSQHLANLTLRARTTAKLHLASVLKVGEHIRVLPRQQKTIKSAARMHLASGLRITETVRITPRVV